MNRLLAKELIEMFSVKAREMERAEHFPVPDVEFFNNKSFAGRALYQEHKIELNETHMASPGEFIETIAHEVAHLVVKHRACQPLKTIEPHGPLWKEVMKHLGYPGAKATFDDNTNMADINKANKSIRRQRRWGYDCVCCKKHYELSTVLHNRILKGESRICNDCRGVLVWDGEVGK